MNIWPMAARLGSLLLLLLLGAACSQLTIESQRIVLLAPFEGRLRDIGYEALYATRLALSDYKPGHISLLAVDDGGNRENALMRAQTFLQDNSIIGIIVVGPYAAQPEVLSVLSFHPTVVAGIWDDAPPPPNVFILGNPQNLENASIDPSLIPQIGADDTIKGNEIIAIAALADRTIQTSILTSAKMPEGSFRDQLTADIFAPDPGPISALSYDATSLILTSASQNIPIQSLSFDGWNGTITFTDGYWVDGPVRQYVYRDGKWILQSSDT